MSTKPFTDVEIIKAVGIKLGEMRNEAKETEQRLRAEFTAELMTLRNEFLRDRLDLERNMKRRSSALPVHDLIELPPGGMSKN